MAAIHPDFAIVQQRLRRLNPAWYPADKAIDEEYGASMAAGLDGALGELERARNLGPLSPPGEPAPLPSLVVAPPRGLAPKFAFLAGTPMPPLMVRVALAELGTLETPGTADNPKILGWADEVGRATDRPYDDWAAGFYNDDGIPWCGLFIAVVAVRAAQGRPERMPPDKYLSALAWAEWGVSVPIEHAAVGDVMVMGRQGGGHVTLNVGTAKGESSFFGLGGNQGDKVSIAEFGVARVRAVRRPAYQALPPGARRVILSSTGVLSQQEA